MEHNPWCIERYDLINSCFTVEWAELWKPSYSSHWCCAFERCPSKSCFRASMWFIMVHIYMVYIPSEKHYDCFFPCVPFESFKFLKLQKKICFPNFWQLWKIYTCILVIWLNFMIFPSLSLPSFSLFFPSFFLLNFLRHISKSIRSFSPILFYRSAYLVNILPVYTPLSFLILSFITFLVLGILCFRFHVLFPYPLISW